MPLITEDEFLLLSEVYNDPTNTPEEKDQIFSKMKEYETFQKNNGLALTPKLDKLIMQEDERTRMNINSLYSGVDNVPIPDNLKSVFSDSESRARYANISYLKYKYGKDFDSSEYDLYKADYANKNFKSLQPTSEIEFYNSIKSSVDAENAATKRLQTNFKKAVESFVSGEQPSVATSRLSKEMPNDFDSNIFNNSYNSLSNTIKNYKPTIYKFIDSYERKLKGESKPEDEKTISEFTTKLSEMPDEHRQLSLIFLRNEAKNKGLDSLKTRNAFSGLADDFTKSFTRIYGEGFSGRSSSELEKIYSSINSTGKTTTTIPNITSLEDAKKYVEEQTLQGLREFTATAGETMGVGTGVTTGIEGGVERELTPDESLYIRQALKESRKALSIDREIRNIGSVLDPVADNWAGLMAGTLGSSAALLLPIAASGPGGGAFATEMYRGMEYNNLMSKYPEMDPRTADNIALVSGAVQGALDFAEVGLLKSLGGKLAKKFAPGMVGSTVEGAYIGDSILADMGLTYGFENVIEGVQDFTTPLVQEVFSRFDSAVPEVNFGEELKEWASTRPDVAIGMIPLTIFGGAASAGSKLYSNSRLLKEASDIERLTDAGIVESDRMTLSKMVEDRDVEGIRSFLPTAWERRDMNLVNSRVAEKLNEKLLSVNAAATLNAAIQAGAIPNFAVNENGQYLVEGVEKPFNTREEVMNYITNRINEINSAKSEIITESVRDVEKTTTELNISSDPVQLDSENDALSQLNGLNKNKINELNNSFGDKVQQDRVFKQIVNDIFTGKKTAETALQEYINGVYNNLPNSTKDALGVDETSGKQALFDLVTMRKDKVEVFEGTPILRFVARNINRTVAPIDTSRISAEMKALHQETSKVAVVKPVKISKAQQNYMDYYAEEENKTNPPNYEIGLLSYDPANTKPEVAAYIDQFNAFIKNFAERFGVNVLFMNKTSGDLTDRTFGLFDENTRTLFIDIKTEINYQQVLGHEFGHFIQKKYPKLYKPLGMEIMNLLSANKTDRYLEFVSNLNPSYFELTNSKESPEFYRQLYISHTKDLASKKTPIAPPLGLSPILYKNLKETVDAELINDGIAIFFTDPSLWASLAKKNKTLFEKVVDAFVDFVNTFKDLIENTIAKITGKKTKLENVTGISELESIAGISIAVDQYIIVRDLLSNVMAYIAREEVRNPVRRQFANANAVIKKAERDLFATENISAMRPKIRTKVSNTITEAPNNEVQHVVNKIRNTVSSAKSVAEKARKRGDKAAGVSVVEETISEIVSPINEESFNAAAKNRSINKNEMDIDEFLKKAKILKNSLRKALSNNDTSLNALSNAAAVVNDSYSDISNLNETDKLKYITDALKKLNNELKDVYIEEIGLMKQTFSSLEADYRNRNKTEVADMFKMYVEAFESTDPSGDASLLFNELYTPNGVPVAKNVKEYNDKLLKYNVLKTVGNYAELNADQLENLIKTLDGFIANVDSTNFVNELETIVDNMRYISETSPTLEKRELEQFNKMNNLRQPTWSGIKKIFQPLTDMISSFTDSHLTFASLIELVYPNNVQTNKKTYARIAELTSILEDSNSTEEAKADASTELNILRESIGKAIIPEMQKVVDDLRNSYTDILIDNEENEENLRKVIAKAFSLKSSASKYVNQKLYELVDRKSGFTVKINNRDYVLSQAYAGYILNLSDTDSHGEALTNAGFTNDVLMEIRKGISKEANEIRLELRKLIRKEHQKANETSLKKMGFGTLIPNETYFPVQYKSTSTAIIDSFDINFQGGITDKDNENVLKSEGRDIELDLNVQAINMLSMFNSHMYLSTHKRNVTAPITVAKAVLLDKDISDRITAAFGNDFYGQLFKLLGAIETNGVRTVEMSRTWRNYMRGLMSGAAKGALALNPTTILLNATSVFNTGLDSSIPFNRAIASYGRVLLATLTGNQLGTIPKTAKEIRQFNIIKQRINGGANSLLAMSKSDPTVSKPNALSNAGDFGMRPISFSDGFFGSFAAAAAYDAHYRMAEESGLSPSEAEAAAEEGMKRTIQTTFQPNTVANKATVEVGSNIVMRMLGMFMSEARKAVGLEITAFKKNGLFSKEFGRFIIVNHFLIGGLSYLIRSSIKDALKGEEEDEDIWNPAQLAQNILVGPLAGLFIVGTALESSAIWLTNNLIDALDVKNERVKADLGIIEIRGKVKKLPVFPKDNIISSTAKQLQDVKDIFEADTFSEGADAAINAGKGLGAILNNNSISGATTLAKTAKTIADAIDENIIDVMEEPKK